MDNSRKNNPVLASAEAVVQELESDLAKAKVLLTALYDEVVTANAPAIASTNDEGQGKKKSGAGKKSVAGKGKKKLRDGWLSEASRDSKGSKEGKDSSRAGREGRASEGAPTEMCTASQLQGRVAAIQAQLKTARARARAASVATKAKAKAEAKAARDKQELQEAVTAFAVKWRKKRTRAAAEKSDKAARMAARKARKESAKISGQEMSASSCP
ncbi:MAG: hypothetical protein ACR2PR_04500 [Pseudohongiellaceae bacterium]